MVAHSLLPDLGRTRASASPAALRSAEAHRATTESPGLVWADLRQIGPLGTPVRTAKPQTRPHRSDDPPVLRAGRQCLRSARSDPSADRATGRSMPSLPLLGGTIMAWHRHMTMAMRCWRGARAVACPGASRQSELAGTPIGRLPGAGWVVSVVLSCPRPQLEPAIGGRPLSLSLSGLSDRSAGPACRLGMPVGRCPVAALGLARCSGKGMDGRGAGSDRWGRISRSIGSEPRGRISRRRVSVYPGLPPGPGSRPLGYWGGGPDRGVVWQGYQATRDTDARAPNTPIGSHGDHRRVGSGAHGAAIPGIGSRSGSIGRRQTPTGRGGPPRPFVRISAYCPRCRSLRRPTAGSGAARTPGITGRQHRSSGTPGGSHASHAEPTRPDSRRYARHAAAPGCRLLLREPMNPNTTPGHHREPSTRPERPAAQLTSAPRSAGQPIRAVRLPHAAVDRCARPTNFPHAAAVPVGADRHTAGSIGGRAACPRPSAVRRTEQAMGAGADPEEPVRSAHQGRSDRESVRLGARHRTGSTTLRQQWRQRAGWGARIDLAWPARTLGQPAPRRTHNPQPITRGTHRPTPRSPPPSHRPERRPRLLGR